MTPPVSHSSVAKSGPKTYEFKRGYRGRGFKTLNGEGSVVYTFRMKRPGGGKGERGKEERFEVRFDEERSDSNTPPTHLIDNPSRALFARAPHPESFNIFSIVSLRSS